MRSAFGVGDPSRELRVAAWLTKYAHADGALVPWKTKVQRASGEPLKIDARGVSHLVMRAGSAAINPVNGRTWSDGSLAPHSADAEAQ
jgi:hypothetical protein